MAVGGILINDFVKSEFIGKMTNIYRPLIVIKYIIKLTGYMQSRLNPNLGDYYFQC